MAQFNSRKIEQWTAGKWTERIHRTITGFCIDSRTLEPGHLFVALKTDKRDGHDYLEEAEARGAAGAIVSRPRPGLNFPQLVVSDPLVALQLIAVHYRLRFEAPVIGVTGSCGKTSTKDLLGFLLGRDQALVTRANLNNHLGVPLTVLDLDADRHRFGVVEIGANARGEIPRLAQICDPTHAIVTLVADTHLEGFGSLQNIAHEKSMIARNLPEHGFAVFPQECLAFSDFRSLRCETFAVQEEGDEAIHPDDSAHRVYYRTEVTDQGHINGCRLTLRQPDAPAQVFTLPNMSPGMISNAVLAIFTASRLGVSDSVIQARLPDWQPTGLRGEIRESAGRTFYVDCYNASPASMVDAFIAFDQAFPGDAPRLYVLGCMAELGEVSEPLHQSVGMALQLRPQDRALLLGRQAQAMRFGLLAAGNDDRQITVLGGFDEAHMALESFRGNVFLKGSRRYQLEKLVPPDAIRPKSFLQQAC